MIDDLRDLWPLTQNFPFSMNLFSSVYIIISIHNNIIFNGHLKQHFWSLLFCLHIISTSRFHRLRGKGYRNWRGALKAESSFENEGIKLPNRSTQNRT